MRFLVLILILIGSNVSTFASFQRKKLNTRRRTSTYCYVRDSELSYEFNFLGLTNQEKDYVIIAEHDKNISLRLQLCEPLKEGCMGVEGYAVCLNKGGKEIGIGKEPPRVIIEFQEIFFKYTGDQCKYNLNYTVNIKMICDYKMKNDNGIGLFAADHDECDFNLEWKTEAACTDRKQVNCAVDDETGHYDLSQLTNISDNYEVAINNTHSIILNVCHTVLYRKNACRTSSSACLINKEKGAGAIGENLGLPTENLTRNSDGSLSLKYMNGKICTHQAAHHTSTTITFFCDLNAVGTFPVYIGGEEQCNYQLTWKTASACSEEALRRKSLENMNSNFCSVKNPVTDYTYNFTALMNKEHTVRFFGTNKVLIFSICGSLSNTTCKAGTGVCKLHNNTSGGMGNSKLLWKENRAYLNYTNGDRCYNNQQSYTIIEFSCHLEFSKNLDYESDENDLCSSKIKIGTHYACENKKICSSLNSEVDLNQLVLKDYNYVIQNDIHKYHINICQPLVKEQGLSCPNGAAICKVTNDHGKQTVTNLGFYDQSPIFLANQSAYLSYTNGSVCEEDKSKRIESVISFLCDIHDKLGYPRLKKYQKCAYFFEWRTKLICGKVEGTFEKHSITNNLGDTRDLSELVNLNGPLLNIKSTYKISLLENKNVCNGSFVCDDKINYGTKASVLYDYNVDTIKFLFSDGSKCGDNSNAQSTLTIVCKEENILTSPHVVKEKFCYVEFEWFTTLICASQNGKRLPLFNTYKSSFFMGQEVIGIAIIILLLLLVLTCYLSNASKRARLIEMFTNSSGRHGDRVKYSRVNTEEEVHLLLNTSDPTVIESDSDDDLLGD